ncbi:MAG: RsmD family RNA methyltransferase [Proteobacteria bacterium]|nr:RsmD family RNA methyltransferase [Pseudomonadota bacterium]
MHIISGLLKHTPLAAPPLNTTDIRPISGKIREALMSMFCDRISGGVIWDMFAGTGSFGLEAASRGAKEVIFFENDPLAKELIQKNIALVEKRLQKNHPQLFLSLISCNLFASVQEQRKSLRHYFIHKPPQLIFADPPYAVCCQWLEMFLSFCEGIIEQPCYIIVKAGRKDQATIHDIFEKSAMMSLIKQKHYGKTSVFVAQNSS